MSMGYSQLNAMLRKVCHEILICYTDKKEKQIFLKYKKIQSGAGAKSYRRKDCLKYEEMRKIFPHI
jgi:hypothetical protein